MVSNSLKFVPEGSGKVAVTAMYVPDGLPKSKKPDTAKQALLSTRAGSVQICVKDNGIGLTKEQIGLLFREFIQFDANRLQVRMMYCVFAFVCVSLSLDT